MDLAGKINPFGSFDVIYFYLYYHQDSFYMGCWTHSIEAWYKANGLREAHFLPNLSTVTIRLTRGWISRESFVLMWTNTVGGDCRKIAIETAVWGGKWDRKIECEMVRNLSISHLSNSSLVPLALMVRAFSSWFKRVYKMTKAPREIEWLCKQAFENCI